MNLCNTTTGTKISLLYEYYLLNLSDQYRKCLGKVMLLITALPILMVGACAKPVLLPETMHPLGINTRHESLCRLALAFDVEEDSKKMAVTKSFNLSENESRVETFEIGRIFASYLRQKNLFELRYGTSTKDVLIPISVKIHFIDLDYKKDWDDDIYWAKLSMLTESHFSTSLEPKGYLIQVEARDLPLFSGGRFNTFLNTPLFSTTPLYPESALSRALQGAVEGYVELVLEDINEDLC